MADTDTAPAASPAVHDLSGSDDLSQQDHMDLAHAHSVAASEHASQAAHHVHQAGAVVPDTVDRDSDGDSSTSDSRSVPYSARTRAMPRPGTGAARAMAGMKGRIT